MPTPAPKHKQAGSRTIRLADIPDDIRIAAAHKLIAETNDIDELLRLIELAHAPGDAGGRIAA